MKIQVIGENSSNRTKLLKNINKVTKEKTLSDNIIVEILDDKKSMEKYNNVCKPVLLINDKIVSNGKILTEREIKNYIKVLS